MFDDDDEDNENVISLEKIKASTLGLLSPTKANGDRSSIDGDSESRASFAEKRVVPLTDIQDPFQPSSTPAHFQHRYMVKNFFGFQPFPNYIYHFYFFSYGMLLGLYVVLIQRKKEQSMLNSTIQYFIILCT